MHKHSVWKQLKKSYFTSIRRLTQQKGVKIRFWRFAQQNGVKMYYKYVVFLGHFHLVGKKSDILVQIF